METKELVDKFDELAQTVESLKSATDESTKNAINEAISTQNDEIKALKVAMARTNVSDAVEEAKEDSAKAWNDYVRKGDESGLQEIKAATANTVTDSEGGFLVPLKLEEGIIKLLNELTPARMWASVKSVGAAVYTKNYQTSHANVGWRGETAPVTGTNSPDIGQYQINTHELQAYPQVTLAQLEDSHFDYEAWLASEVGEQMAIAENEAFVNGLGDASFQPTGLLSYINGTAESTREIAEVAAAGAAVTGDDLLTLIYAVKPQFRTGAKWLMNRQTLEQVRKLKDADGNYLFSVQAQLDGRGIIGTVLGYEVCEDEAMPDPVSGATPIIFGNLKGYSILDRVGMSVLRNPYKNPGFVEFYTRKRVGGGLEDAQGMRALRLA